MATKYNQARELSRKQNFALKQIMPFRYVFVLTNLCNLRCSFCFQEKKYIPGSFALEDWLSVINQLPTGSHITFTGGEPLLFPDFVELIDNVPDTITFNIITNGLLLTPEISDLLTRKPGFKVLSISIDDIGNQSRDFSDTQWLQLLQNISDFKNIRRKNQLPDETTVLDIKSVVHPGNQADFFSMATFVSESIKADTHMLMFLKGSPMQHADVMFDYDIAFKENNQYEDYGHDIIAVQLHQLKSYIETSTPQGTQYFLHPKYTDFYSGFSAERFIRYLSIQTHDPSIYEMCLSPWESVHINNDGNVFPCLAFNLGNVRSNPLSEIMSGDAMNKFKDDLKQCGTLPACKHCGYLKPSKTS